MYRSPRSSVRLPQAFGQGGPRSPAGGPAGRPILGRMASSRSRRTLWSLALVMVLVNAPLLTSLATQARIGASGTEATAEVIGGRLRGDEADPEYWLYYRFAEELDESREPFAAEVDRATYTRGRESGELAVEVVEGDPTAHRVEGAQPRRLGTWITLGVDAVALLLLGLWWRRRRPDTGEPAEPLPHSGA